LIHIFAYWPLHYRWANIGHYCHWYCGHKISWYWYWVIDTFHCWCHSYYAYYTWLPGFHCLAIGFHYWRPQIRRSAIAATMTDSWLRLRQLPILPLRCHTHINIIIDITHTCHYWCLDTPSDIFFFFFTYTYWLMLPSHIFIIIAVLPLILKAFFSLLLLFVLILLDTCH